MPATYEPIASTTLGSSAASYTFSSIPSTYTDLILVCSIDTTYTIAAGASMFMRLNGDTSSNYSSTWLVGSGSAASSSRNSSQTSMYIGEAPGSSNYPTPIICHIQNYANTNVYKTALCGSAHAGWYVSRSVGLWRSTSAITSLTVLQTVYDMTADSSLALYGIKAA
jgi:hypothetical protein